MGGEGSSKWVKTKKVFTNASVVEMVNRENSQVETKVRLKVIGPKHIRTIILGARVSAGGSSPPPMTFSNSICPNYLKKSVLSREI